MGVLGRPMIAATAPAPKQAYDGAKHLAENGARLVEILDVQTGKVLSVDAFAKEHRLR